MTVLQQVAIAFREKSNQRPSADSVVDALLEAEKAAKRDKISYSFESLQGKWRLYFATGTRKVRERGGIMLGKGYYLPKFIPAYISFSTNSTGEIAPDRGEISNQIKLGSFLLKFTGPLQYLGKKNLLAFDFTQIQISMFNRVVYKGKFGKNSNEDFYSKSIGKLPFFAFFIVTKELISARGRGGGLAIWIKENQSS